MSGATEVSRARPAHRRRSLWQRTLDSDDGRTWVAALAAVVVVLTVTTVFREDYRVHPGWDGVRRLFYVSTGMMLVLMYVGYILLTLRRFRGLDPRTLERDLRTVSRGARPSAWAARWGMTHGSTLGWTVSVSVYALVLVVLVMLDPISRGDLLLRLLSALVVAASWAMLVVSQALAYARLTGSRARAAMRDHVLVGFAFNSMLVASLATLLLTTG